MSKLADNIPLIEILATANVALSFYYDTAKIFTVTVHKSFIRSKLSRCTTSKNRFISTGIPKIDSLEQIISNIKNKKNVAEMKISRSNLIET